MRFERHIGDPSARIAIRARQALLSAITGHQRQAYLALERERLALELRVHRLESELAARPAASK